MCLRARDETRSLTEWKLADLFVPLVLWKKCMVDQSSSLGTGCCWHGRSLTRGDLSALLGPSKPGHRAPAQWHTVPHVSPQAPGLQTGLKTVFFRSAFPTEQSSLPWDAALVGNLQLYFLRVCRRSRWERHSVRSVCSSCRLEMPSTRRRLMRRTRSCCS